MEGGIGSGIGSTILSPCDHDLLNCAGGTIGALMAGAGRTDNPFALILVTKRHRKAEANPNEPKWAY